MDMIGVKSVMEGMRLQEKDAWRKGMDGRRSQHLLELGGKPGRTGQELETVKEEMMGCQ